MKKILPPLAALVLLTLFFVGATGAVSVTVTCTPEAINPGGSSTITVECDIASSGTVTVTTPGGPSYSVPITIPAGDSASVVYPDDFPNPASTSELGEYTVAVDLSGSPPKYLASFFVFFQVVIPDFPIVGTAGAALAMLASLGLHRIRRRELT